MAYENKDPQLLEKFHAGYPRFFENPLINQLRHVYHQSGLLRHLQDPVLPTYTAAAQLLEFLNLSKSEIYQAGTFFSLSLEGDPTLVQQTHDFCQHTGTRISSREAEDALHADGYLDSTFDESLYQNDSPDAETFIKQYLHDIYGTAYPDDIYLCRGGMNAFFAGFLAIKEIQKERDKDLWIQLGWIYVDTIRILEKWSSSPPIVVNEIYDLQPLKDVLKEHGKRVAGIVTEIPTNPLVQTADIEELRKLADKYRCALILDPTLVSPHNVNVLPYADLHINSLTKYCAQEADVMLGALAVNSKSRFYKELKYRLPEHRLSPYTRDLRRLAVQVPHYKSTIQKVNRSIVHIVDFLSRHPDVDEVYWACRQPHAWNFNWIQHGAAGPGSIVTFTLRKPVAEFYDKCNIVKSPSFGARFSMMCPFMYLAHYDLVKSEKGRAYLRSQNLNPDLIRLSVGTEPVEQIIEELARAL